MEYPLYAAAAFGVWIGLVMVLRAMRSTALNRKLFGGYVMNDDEASDFMDVIRKVRTDTSLDANAQQVLMTGMFCHRRTYMKEHLTVMGEAYLEAFEELGEALKREQAAQPQ